MQTFFPDSHILAGFTKIVPKGWIVHHSAGNADETPEGLRDWFIVGRKAEGFKWIGYHLLIYPDGTRVQCRPFNVNGGHVKPQYDSNGKLIKSFNSHYIGICFVGNYNNMELTKEAWQAYSDTVREITKEFNLKETDWLYHGQVSSTECPGKNIIKVLGTPLAPEHESVTHNEPVKTLKDYSTLEIIEELKKRYANG
jgi:N-acetylmuramoyl-L-alanine amidase